MGKLRCCSLAVLACIALATGAGWQTGTAAAADLTEWQDNLSEQTSSSTASASAQNDSSTSQRATQVQVDGGSAGGQSQSTVQTAPTQQTATASATSTQNATNVAGGGAEIDEPPPSEPPSSIGEEAPTDTATGSGASVPPADTSDAAAVAGNVNRVTQDATQAQNTDGSSSSQSQASAQSASTTQTADATATSTQVAPIDTSIAPGTSTSASAAVPNTNATAQSVTQTQSGVGPPSGEAQTAAQSAPTAQEATASSTQGSTPYVSVTLGGRPRTGTRSTGSENVPTQTSSPTARGSPTKSGQMTGALPLETQVGGSAGGSHLVGVSHVRAIPSAAGEANASGQIAGAVDVPKIFEHRSAAIAKVLAALPDSALRRGLDSDGTMIMRLAKLLALIYAAFLTIWFWATRVRWNGR
jgi:hypothetical protein